MTCPDSKYDALAWGSHLPALLACVGDTVGNVLEIGAGHFSTPALHALCGAMRRKLVSVEKVPEWADSFRFLADRNHIISSDYPITKEVWGVAFIDDSPGGENRAIHFKELLHISQYLVVHDYHLDNKDNISPWLEFVPFKHVTRTYPPPTLIASMTRPIPKSVLCL